MERNENTGGTEVKRIKLKFRVDPDELREKSYVPNGIKIKFIDPEKVFILGILGESGKKLIKAGISFWFIPKLANWFIKEKIAVKQ